MVDLHEEEQINHCPKCLNGSIITQCFNCKAPITRTGGPMCLSCGKSYLIMPKAHANEPDGSTRLLESELATLRGFKRIDRVAQLIGRREPTSGDLGRLNISKMYRRLMGFDA